MLLGVSILSMTSCNNKEVSAPSIDDGAKSQLLIETDEFVAVRSTSMRYAVEAYTDATYTTAAPIFSGGTESSVVTSAGAIDLSLDADTEYYLLMWADYGSAYDVTSLANVSLIEGEEMSEAWQGTLTISDNTSETYTAYLKRAIGKVNLNEVDEFYSPKLNVAFDACTAFNVAEGDVTGESSAFSIDYTYDIEDGVTGLLNEDPIYIFAPVETASVIDFTFTDINETFTLSNVPVQANYVTTLNGHFTSLFVGSITASTTSDWYANPEATDVIEFTDSVFEEVILEALGKIAGEAVTVEDALSLTSLTINSKGITDMTEIKYFTNLTTLACTSNKLTYLDVSDLVNLTVLQCGANTSLGTIILPEDPSKIVTLYVYNTAITELDLTSGFTSLKTLYAYDCLGLTTVNFRNCSAMATGNIARCTNMQIVYLNEGQTNSGSWVFKEITECTFICIDSKGVETEYASGTITGTWN